jgi:type 1 glutamine amidotransferase
MRKIRTLLLSGGNNHDWQRSTPFCKELLENSGQFEVEVTTTPSDTLADAASLGEYELIFTDYNGPDWHERAQTNFEQKIRNGAGLVVLHAANNAFPDWTAYKMMLGLTFVANVSSHGDFHEFSVRITDRDHPITRGLSDFRTWDELYHATVPTPGSEFRVLATAYSSPDRGGSGNVEPIIAVLEYGRGRVFHLMLGHVWPHDFNSGYKGYQMVAFENENFQQCLLRGAEWAATGSVQEQPGKFIEGRSDRV